MLLYSISKHTQYLIRFFQLSIYVHPCTAVYNIGNAILTQNLLSSGTSCTTPTEYHNGFVSFKFI